MVRFGIIGTSWITDEFIRCAGLTGDFILSGVYSRTAGRAREFAEKYGVKKIFTDLEEMSQSQFIDAVYIASPNSFHAPQALIMLNGKKHVLVEKPAASNARELAAMIDAARKNRVVLMEALKTTLLPNFQTVRDNLSRIGQVRRFLTIKCQYSSRYDRYKQGLPTNTFNPELANGSLMDIGVYCLYPIMALFGRPSSIRANAVMLESGIDGEGSVCLQYDGMEAVAIHSKIADSGLPSEIQGEQGNIIIDKISTPEKVEIVYKGGAVEDITRDQSPDLMYYEAREFIDLIQKGRLESTINNHQLSLEVMKVMDEARRQIGLRFPAD
ncbi:MAG: Gfo/Idh/MocA family protein [Bacillota bacterium]